MIAPRDFLFTVGQNTAFLLAERNPDDVELQCGTRLILAMGGRERNAARF